MLQGQKKKKKDQKKARDLVLSTLHFSKYFTALQLIGFPQQSWEICIQLFPWRKIQIDQVN